MRWRVIGLVSLGVNIVLLAIWLSGPLPGTRRFPTAKVVPGQAEGSQTRTNFVLRRQLFSWQEVESPDYTTYIRNLRAIGCPEQTIRDIIIADINALFARRRATELVTPEQQWWRSEPDAKVLQVALEAARGLEEERRALLSRLLGPNWESGDLVSLPRPSRPGLVLDGPVLGNLPMEMKQALEEINLRSEERMKAYLETQAESGKAPDPSEVAKLRQQTRDDLARVLSPGQLEEFLLRYSQYADTLRTRFGKLQFFDATSEEFRNVFRATDSMDQQIQLLTDKTDPNSEQLRKSLETQREAAIRTALGAKRYAEYEALHNPLYREALADAMAEGVPESAAGFYQVRLAAAQIAQEIQSNTNLNPDQKAIEAKQLELEQLMADTLLKGGQLPPEQPSPPPRRTYALRQGDTPAVISMIYGVPESAIRAANPNVNFARLKPGDVINVPRSAPAGPPPQIPYGP